MSRNSPELHVGDRLHLEMELNGVSYLAPVTVLGYVDSRGLKVSRPEAYFPLSPGEPLKAHFFGETGKQMFASKILALKEAPFKCLHIYYPSEKGHSRRGQDRLTVRSEGIYLVVRDYDGVESKVKMSDISLSGACLLSSRKLGDFGERLQVEIRSPFGPGQVSLTCEICYCQQESTQDGFFSVQHGVKFVDLDEDAGYFIECFVGRGWYRGSRVI